MGHWKEFFLVVVVEIDDWKYKHIRTGISGIFGLANHQVSLFTALLKDHLKFYTSILEPDIPMISGRRKKKSLKSHLKT